MGKVARGNSQRRSVSRRRDRNERKMSVWICQLVGTCLYLQVRKGVAEEAMGRAGRKEKSD
jgi:hypothetical protein